MGITSLTAASLARPLQTLQRWWQQIHPSSMEKVPAVWLRNAAAATPSSPAPSVAVFHRSRKKATAAGAWRATARTTQITRDPGASALALPTLRVLHRPANLARPGGLVIAGRMADVCAELDRLVAMEALH